MKKFIAIIFIIFTTLFFTSFAQANNADPGIVNFYSGEHVYLGNDVHLLFPAGDSYQDTTGGQADFRVWLNLNLDEPLTYGKIVAAPDMFADPNYTISDGKSLLERQALFEKSFIAFLTAKPKTLNAVYAIMDDEVAMIQDALEHKIEPSEKYSENKKSKTPFAIRYFQACPETAKLFLIGWDHFGQHAWLSYEAGHTEAINTAIEAYEMQDPDKKRRLLALAYAKEGYADHFLSDRFAAGHMRTPDKALSLLREDKATEAVGALLAIFMHDEDNANGVEVTNAQGDHWTAYGDAYFLDTKNAKNKELVDTVMQNSADEVRSAFQTGFAIPPKQYAAINMVSNLETLADYLHYVDSKNKTIPLFVYEAKTNTVFRRLDINKLHPKEKDLPFNKKNMVAYGGFFGWHAWKTLLELEFSYHPTLFANINTDINNYLQSNGELNRAGFKLLSEHLNILDKTIICSSNTSTPICKSTD